MPREQINYPRNRVEHAGSLPDDDQPVPEYARRGVAGSANEPTINVGWLASPDGAGWVQVHMEADPAYFRFVADNPDGPPLDDGSKRTSAYSPVLNRDEINKLIRVLRRARDQAYGRDE
jgi:hypothetical protein